MRNFTLPLMIAASLSLSAPLHAEANLGDIVSGLAQTLLNQEIDKNAYVAAQSANTVSAYRGYLKQYPKGLYRANAVQALAKLGVVVDPGNPKPPGDGGALTPVQQEAAIGLTASDRVTIQRRLTALGYNTHGTDGSWGYNTRTAIANWQSANHLAVTAYLTGAQVNLLMGQTGPVVTPPGGDPGGNTGGYTAAQVEASLGLTRGQRIQIQQQLTAIGYNTGVADGLWGSNTRTAIGRWQTKNKMAATGYVTGNQVQMIASQAGTVVQPNPPTGGAGNAALEESLLSLTAYEKADLQNRLTHLGYNTYGADGVFGRNSRNAIARWQGDEGLTVTGYLSADEVRKIRVETGN